MNYQNHARYLRNHAPHYRIWYTKGTWSGVLHPNDRDRVCATTLRVCLEHLIERCTHVQHDEHEYHDTEQEEQATTERTMTEESQTKTHAAFEYIQP
jgi:hypothetical protein